MAPVVLALRQAPWVECRVLVTAQHRELLDQTLAFFDIAADRDLDIMTAGQTLPALTARLLVQLDKAFAALKPDVVLAQGDTTTVLCTALACFYRNIPFGHVEAGLRTGNMRCPFPEEANRVLAGRLATLHFAPTETARENLLREGVPAKDIHVTGNTVIDALHAAAARNLPMGVDVDPAKRLVLITAHRRENFGRPLENICEAVAKLRQRHPDVAFLWPVHPNPAVRKTVFDRIGRRNGVILCDPLEYGRFVSVLKRASLILTDSGGLQEEGPALGKPVLVMRDTTERPEAVAAGVARLVGTDTDRIVEEVARLLTDPAAYAAMASGRSPFGDGHAAQRIVDILERKYRNAGE
jgi:UDP-N-acetylglucosamine 2-epimerase (non-hydrolysing)